MRIDSKEMEMTLSRGDGAAMRPRRGRARLAGTALGLLGALLATIALTQPAYADFGFAPGAVAGTYKADASGTITGPETQAGATPFAASTSFALNSTTTTKEVPAFFPPGSTYTQYVTRPDENVKDIVVDLPPGVVGDPQATPQCPRSNVKGAVTDYTFCPPSTQVGVVKLGFGSSSNTLTDSALSYSFYPVYNMVPRNDDAAEFAFAVQGFGGTKVVASIRPTDHGLRTTIRNISIEQPLVTSELTFWGVPADPRHDAQRDVACVILNAFNNFTCTGPGVPSGAAPKAFLRNPTVCDGSEPVTRMRADSWQHPGVWATGSAISPPVTGCDRVPFPARASVQSDATRAGAPAGLDVAINVQQTDDPGVLASSHLKQAVVTLPVGMAVNPSAANGLAGCSLAQIGLESNDAPSCPDGSRIGSVSIKTPVLPDSLEGSVYLASQGDNPFHSLLALYLVVHGQGVMLKLPGEVVPDPQTGRLTASFDDNPQLPFSELDLHLDGGPRAALVMPSGCGTFQTEVELTAWSGRAVRSSSPMRVDQGCDQAQKFDASLSAGTVDPVAGAFSPLVLRFSRPDGQQELGAINGSLPPGLLGVLKSVPLCSAAQGAAGTCPAASRVGKVQIAAGAGSSPVWLPVAGQGENGVFLTEPYRKGDVAGMSIVTRAVAGPFDLGTVVTKVYLKLREKDQGIDMQSDRLPRILQGVPLNIREVVVTIDRDGFMVNPTSCAAMATYANVFSQSWVKASITSRFQVGGCADLALSPIITARAGGKGDTARYEHPALRVSIRQPAGQAHLSKTNVVLPKELNVDLKAPALKAACPREDYAQDKCSPVATIGTVRAVTPLLKEPLTGPAFLIQKKGKLPDIVMRLRNNRMSLDLIGVLDFLKDGRLITRVANIPDAALSSFVLSIKGGKNGSLLNRSSLCAKTRLVKTTFKGQNGKRAYKTPVMHVAGCAKARAKAKAKASRSSRAAARRAGARVSAAAGAVSAGARAAAAVRGGDQRAAGGRS